MITSIWCCYHSTNHQFLVDAEEPLLYHTGMRRLFPLVKEAIGSATLQRRLVALPTPHVPHNRESHMLFEQKTRTLLLGEQLVGSE